MTLQAIRRGTWLAVQLQIVWVLLIYLAAWVMQQHLAQQQQPSVFSQTLVHVLALAATLGALSCRPWLLPAPRKLSEAGLLPPAAGAAAEAAPGHDEGKEGEGSRVDVAAEASSRQPGLVAEGEENRGADRGEPSKMQTQSQVAFPKRTACYTRSSSHMHAICVLSCLMNAIYILVSDKVYSCIAMCARIACLICPKSGDDEGLRCAWCRM